MSSSKETPEESKADKCPVDHSTRSAWTAAAMKSKAVVAATHNDNGSCDSSNIDQSPISSELRKLVGESHSGRSLSERRTISSIPRGSESTYDNGNAETPPTTTSAMEAAASTVSKNWIYPSEQMFFDAMKRKNWDPRAEDMRMIVPIHNAVNEKAWTEIINWERGRGSEKCGGPKLLSFSGDSRNMTPKARLLVLLGYQAPFDRHDWVVDRCGKRIEYVIDFYAGKRDTGMPEAVSFYLDVRPKLSFEGVKMRIQRWFGF